MPPALRAIVARLPPGRRASARDRALLLLGFAGAFRRSELVAICVEDLSFDAEGLSVYLPRSKTDQEGFGAKVRVPFGDHPETCPVESVRGWVRALGRTKGPLFWPVSARGKLGRKPLSDKAVALIVKRHLGAIGLDGSGYAGHSLRRGLATTAAREGKPQWTIKAQGRWKTDAMAWLYIEEAKLRKDNAAKGIGL